jgi:hypothetical protein
VAEPSVDVSDDSADADRARRHDGGGHQDIITATVFVS